MDTETVHAAEEAPEPDREELLRRAAAHQDFYSRLRAETNSLYSQMKAFVGDARRLEHPLYAQFCGKEGEWVSFRQLKERFEAHALESQEEISELAASVGELLPCAAAYDPGFFKAVLTAAEKHPDSERECFARLEVLGLEMGAETGRELLLSALRKHYCVLLSGLVISIGASLQKADDLHKLIVDFKCRYEQFTIEVQPYLRIAGEQAEFLRSRFEQFLAQLRAACRSLPETEIAAHVRKRFEVFAETESRPAADLLEATVCLITARACAANIPLENALLPCLADFMAEDLCELQGAVAETVGELARLSNLGALPPRLDEEGAPPAEIYFPSLSGVVQKLCALSQLRRPADRSGSLVEAIAAATAAENAGRVNFDALDNCGRLFRLYLAAGTPLEPELEFNSLLVDAVDKEELFAEDAVDQDLKQFLRVGSQLLETDSEAFLSREAELVDLKARFGRMARESESLCAECASLAPFREPSARLFRAFAALVSQRLQLLQNLFHLYKAVTQGFSEAFAAAENLSMVKLEMDSLYRAELVEKVVQSSALNQALRDRVRA